MWFRAIIEVYGLGAMCYLEEIALRQKRKVVGKKFSRLSRTCTQSYPQHLQKGLSDKSREQRNLFSYLFALITALNMQINKLYKVTNVSMIK
jgi:hypothetical protein